MYISHIKVKGFRNFKDSDIEFNDGLNVLIGHNNAGKTNLLKALQLVIEPHYRSRNRRGRRFKGLCCCLKRRTRYLIII